MTHARGQNVVKAELPCKMPGDSCAWKSESISAALTHGLRVRHVWLVGSCRLWRFAETPLPSSSWGVARSAATRRRPQDPCRDSGAPPWFRILHRCALRSTSRNGSQGLRAASRRSAQGW